MFVNFFGFSAFVDELLDSFGDIESNNDMGGYSDYVSW